MFVTYLNSLCKPGDVSHNDWVVDMRCGGGRVQVLIQLKGKERRKERARLERKNTSAL